MMKKIIFLFLFIPLFSFAQVPQGVGYQGVATDANGIELVNQSISIRASVLSGSSSGTIQWQEIHNTSTDTFGLFNLTIGQGISTGNGAQTSFDEIVWGANTHFLKIEMDVNGGTNYSHMGTNQMMSVPYALYAENANINYDSIATIISNDSTFINNFSLSGNMVFGDMEDPNINLSYSNPSYSFYYSDTVQAQEDGFLMIFIPGSSGTSSLSVKVSDSSSFLSANTVEYNISETQSYSWSDAFTVPVKKNNFYLVNRFSMNNITLKWLPIVTETVSSSSNVDSAYIDSLVQYYVSNSSGQNIGSGCDFLFPDGLNGDPIIWHLPGNNYTVPLGKNLYITSFTGYNLGDNLQIDGMEFIEQQRTNEILVAAAGSIVSTNSNTSSSYANFTGLLVDAIVDPISWPLANNNYVVPSGKTLYITSFAGGPNSGNGEDMQIDGIELIQSNDRKGLIMVNSGSVISTISTTNANPANFNGYLVDENYFANCLGGNSLVTTVPETNDFSDTISYSDFDNSRITEIPQNLNGKRLIFYSSEKSIYLTDSLGSFTNTIYSVNSDNISCLTSNDNGDTLYFLQTSSITSPPQIMMMTTNNLNAISIGFVPKDYDRIRQFKYYDGNFYYLDGQNNVFNKIEDGSLSVLFTNYVTSFTRDELYTSAIGTYHISNAPGYQLPSLVYECEYSPTENRMYLWHDINNGRINYFDYTNNSISTVYNNDANMSSSTNFKCQVIRYYDGKVYFNFGSSLLSVDSDGTNSRLIGSTIDNTKITGVVIME